MKRDHVGRVTECLMLNYRTPADSVRHLLPAGLEPVTRGPWAYWNVAACRVETMRPANITATPGAVVHHIAYRLRAQAMTADAQLHRGFFVVRSDSDAPRLGVSPPRPDGVDTPTSRIVLDATRQTLRLRVTPADPSDVDVATSDGPPRREPGSSFATLLDVREFCQREPNGLSIEHRDGVAMLCMAEVRCEAGVWQETPVRIEHARLGFFDHLSQTQHACLEYAARVAPFGFEWTRERRAPLLVQPIALPPKAICAAGA